MGTKQKHPGLLARLFHRKPKNPPTSCSEPPKASYCKPHEVANKAPASVPEAFHPQASFTPNSNLSEKETVLLDQYWKQVYSTGNTGFSAFSEGDTVLLKNILNSCPNPASAGSPSEAATVLLAPGYAKGSGEHIFPLDPPSIPPARLIRVDDHTPIEIHSSPFVIGRPSSTGDDHPDYALQDRKISRPHAAILYENRQFYLQDLGSTNGTFFHGKRMDKGVPQPLHSGDHFMLYQTEFVFEV